MADVSKRRSNRERAGARALSLLATSPNATVLRVLAGGPCSLAALRDRGGSPGSTLRARLRDLSDAGVVVARVGNGFGRGAAEYGLTDAGRDLLDVAEVLEGWLVEAESSGGPFGADRSKSAIGALAEGWSTTLIRALAAKPLSIAELDSLIGGFNYPSLERRIAAMRHTGLVEACRSNGRETPYAVTSWLRRGVAPLLSAIRWERRHPAGNGTPLAAIDVEALLLLAMPLVELKDEVSGSCRLTVDLSSPGNQRIAGVLVDVREGEIAVCTSRLDGSADAWATGPVSPWLRALIDDDRAALESGGDGRLARSLVAGLHRALYARVAGREDEAALA